MLEQMANIAEIAGTVVVIVTIVFLIIQERQNTQALKSATTLNLTSRMAENYRYIALNEDVSRFVTTGLTDPESLSSEDLVRYTAWMIHAVLNFQDLYFQAQYQAYDRDQYEGIMRLLAQLTRSPGFKLFWDKRKFMFSESFQSFMENEVDSFYVEEEFEPLTILPGKAQ